MGFAVHEARCVRGVRCEDRRPGVDPETGTVTQVGALVEHDVALCPTCIRYTRYALGSLHWDVAELSTLMQPAMEVHYRDPGLPDQPRVKKHAPLLFDGSAEALRAFIDHEATVWAEAVVVESGETWDEEWVQSTRIGFRVEHTAALLADNVLLLLSIPAARRRTYSTGTDAADGHDPDEATAHGGYVLTTRAGLDGALSFLHIHHQVQAFAGRIPSDRLRMPCPRCHRLDLHREHYKALTDSRSGEQSQGRVVCRTCWEPMTDAQYEELRATAARAFGIAL